MRRPTKIALWIAGLIALPLVGFLLFRFVIYDWDAEPYCHKQMTIALLSWTTEQSTPAFPNIEGDSLRSMGAMAQELVVTNQIFRDYQYVPGLQGDDPKDLVLFYFNKPTRWRSHLKPERRWTRKTWIVVPVDAYNGYDGGEGAVRIGLGPQQIVDYGEQSESLTTEQFTHRLMSTLDFLRTNNRPHWQAVVKEHTAFLDSLSRKR